MRKTKSQTDVVQKVRRRLANAVKRAWYWSEVPSFNDLRCSLANDRMTIDENYDRAMDDVCALTKRLEELTGKAVRLVDPNEEFRARYARSLTRQKNV